MSFGCRLASAASETSPWLILTTMLLGTLFGTFANSMVAIAVPSLMESFQLPLSSTVYAMTLYTLTMAVFMPVSGSLGTIFGFKKVYLSGMAIFTVASLLGGLAQNFPWLLACRVLQGIGTSTFLPAVMAAITMIFGQNQRGRAVGFWALANGAGHAFGPPISGVMVQHAGWRSIFALLVPFSLLGFILVSRFVPADQKAAVEKFDVAGAALLGVASFCLMFALNQAGRWGLTSPVSLAFWSVVLLAFALFILRERRCSKPFVDLKLFSNWRYAAAIGVVSVDSLGLFGLLVILPVFLIRMQQAETQMAGFVMLFLTLTMALFGPPAGRLSDRLGNRLVCQAGLLLMAAGSLGLMGLYLLLQNRMPWWSIIACLVVLGASLGLIQSPATAAVIRVIDPSRIGIATGVFHMIRFVMGALGSMVFGLALDLSPGGVSSGFNHSLVGLAVAAVLGFIISFWLPGRQGSKSRGVV